MFHEHETYEGHGEQVLIDSSMLHSYTHTGMISHDQAKNEGVEDIQSKEDGRNETRICLERFDMVSQAIIQAIVDSHNQISN